MERHEHLLDELVSRYPELADCRGDILRGAQLLIAGFEANGLLLVCGNGGSAADAQHIVGEIVNERPIDTDAPEHVHMTVREQSDSDRVVVHLVNRHAGRRAAGSIFPCIQEIQPVLPFRLSVRVGFKPSSVSLAPDIAPISGYRHEDGVISLDVPGFDIHSLVVIQR